MDIRAVQEVCATDRSGLVNMRRCKLGAAVLWNIEGQ